MKIFLMGNFDKSRGAMSVGHTSWTSGLEKRIMMKINFIQHFLEYWRSYFMTQDFWSFTWLWTLLQMKISSLRIRFAVGQGAKKKLMSWVGSRIPKPYLEKGFPACFQDGVVLCALVEKLSNGACPRFDVLDPEQKLRNLKLALFLVAKHLHVKPGVSAEQILQGGKLSERQLLLLLAHMKMASEKLKLFQNRGKAAAPPTNRKNVTPSPFDSHKNCSARGMGLMLAVQGRKACFSVLICSTENLDMVIEIRGPKNTACSKRITSVKSLSRGNSIDLCDIDVRNEILKKRIPLDYKILGNKISVSYTPLENGTHHMSIIWQGQHIPGSPYAINVDRSMDVPDQDIWCPRVERGVVLKQSDSLSIPESDEHPNDRLYLQSCDSKRRGRIIRKRILRYIVKVGGNDVVIDDPEQLSDVINSLRRISEDKGIASNQDAAKMISGCPKSPVSGSNVLATEQLQTCVDARGNATETVIDIDKTLSKSTSPIMQLYGLSTEHSHTSTSTFSDADLRHKQLENDQSFADAESPILRVSRGDTIGNSNPSDLTIAFKGMDLIGSESVIALIQDSNGSPTNQTFSTISHPGFIDKQAMNVHCISDNTSTRSIDGEQKYGVSSEHLTSILHEKMLSNKSMMENCGSPEESNNMVGEPKTTEHSSATRCNINCNMSAENYVDLEMSRSQNEGIFFAKLMNGNLESESFLKECDGINVNEKCNVNITNEAIDYGTLKSHGNGKVKKDTQTNSKHFREALTKQLCNRSEEIENEINEKEVLPYIQQIIETADKLRSGRSFKIKDGDSRLKDTNLAVAEYEEKMSTNAKYSEFQSKLRNKVDINYNKKEFERKSKESRDSFKDSKNLNLNIEESLILNLNLTKHSEAENDLWCQTQSEKSANSSYHLRDSKEQLDNKLNAAHETYLKNIINVPKVCVSGNSLNNRYSFSDGKEASNNKIRGVKERLKNDEMTIAAVEEAGWRISKISSETEMVSAVNDKNNFQGNEAKSHKAKLLNFNPDATVRSNVSLFECDHSFPRYDVAEQDLYSTINSSESPLLQNQNNGDDDFVSNFLQNIEDLSFQIKKDETISGDSRVSNNSEEVSSEKGFSYRNLSNKTDYVGHAKLDDHSKTASDFEEIVFEIHQNDTSKAERHSQRKRTSWSDKTSLPCIRESSVEGILDGDGNITYLNTADQNHLDTEMIGERKDSLSRNLVESTDSKYISLDSAVNAARVVSVRNEEKEHGIKSGNMKGDNPTYEANISPLKRGHQNSGKTSISLLCASPYGFKNDNITREGYDNLKTARGKYSTFSNDSNPAPSQVEHAVDTPANGHETEQAGPSSTLLHLEGTGGCIEQTSQTDAGKITDEVINCCVTDQKLSPIPSVRKVIEIFQKEREEPFDKWPEPETNAPKKSPRKIVFGNGSECSKPDSTEPNHINFTINCGKEENQNNATSIKDRVRLFENENPKRNYSLKMKHGVSKPPTAATILDKKRYWENFSH